MIWISETGLVPDTNSFVKKGKTLFVIVISAKVFVFQEYIHSDPGFINIYLSSVLLTAIVSLNSLKGTKHGCLHYALCLHNQALGINNSENGWPSLMFDVHICTKENRHLYGIPKITHHVIKWSSRNYILQHTHQLWVSWFSVFIYSDLCTLSVKGSTCSLLEGMSQPI